MFELIQNFCQFLFTFNIKGKTIFANERFVSTRDLIGIKSVRSFYVDLLKIGIIFNYMLHIAALHREITQFSESNHIISHFKNCKLMFYS